MRHVSWDEVKSAALHMGERKSPGPDGFSGTFYHKFWHIIGEDIFRGVKEFFSLVFC